MLETPFFFSFWGFLEWMWGPVGTPAGLFGVVATESRLALMVSDNAKVTVVLTFSSVADRHREHRGLRTPASWAHVPRRQPVRIPRGQGCRARCLVHSKHLLSVIYYFKLLSLHDHKSSSFKTENP